MDAEVAQEERKKKMVNYQTEQLRGLQESSRSQSVKQLLANQKNVTKGMERRMSDNQEKIRRNNLIIQKSEKYIMLVS